MSVAKMNWNPADRQLRQFGWISLFVLPFLAWVGSAGNSQLTALWVGIGLIVAVIGQIAPRVLKPIFLVLMIVTTPIGIIVGELALVAIYFGLFLPMGLLFRILQRDQLQLAKDPQSETYWRRKRSTPKVAHYYRQS